MHHSTGKANAEQVERWRIASELGCVPCILDGRFGEPPDIQHVVTGGRRVGHDATYACCPWHHRGITKNGLNERQMEAAFGPSLARSRRQYHARYGSEAELLAAQNALVDKQESLLRGYEG